MMISVHIFYISGEKVDFSESAFFFLDGNSECAQSESQQVHKCLDRFCSNCH